VGRDVDLIYALRHLGQSLDERVDGETARDCLIQHWLRIRTKDGKNELMKLNRAQREYSWKCGQRNIVLKARQVGITTYVAARFFLHTITRPGTLTVQVAHSQESAEVIFNIVKRFWENLPEAMKGALVKSRSNVRQIVFPGLDSEYRVETAEENAGRGMTIQNLHCSEVSRWPRGGMETLAALRAAVVPRGEIVLESTPNGASGAFYGEWRCADETGYTKHFFPWWFEESYREIVSGALQPLNKEESDLVQRYSLDAEQIEWRRNQWKMLRSLGEQEYAEDANSCFLVSGECVFEVEAIERAAANAGEVIAVEDNGRLTIWLPPHGGKRYIVGVDTAGGGVDGDYACAQVVERGIGMQCAELHGHFPPYELARRVAELGQRYEDALLAVERNNHGYAVLVHLTHLGCTNLFEQGGKLGWLTSASTRPAMVENMAAVLVESPESFHSTKLLQECRTFVRHVDGSAAAAEGAHDDCVMAMAIALAVRREDVGRDGKRKRLDLRSLAMDAERDGVT
jgi:hypothetical protein